MRVLVIDPDPARTALVAAGLVGVEPLDVRRCARFDEAEATAFAPDVVVVACESPDRDTLESLREATAANAWPVVMFVDRSEPALADAAVHAGVAAYVVDIARATRTSPSLSLGVSPRGATALMSTARAWAWLNGRGYVTPDDVKALAHATLTHRLSLRPEAELEGVDVSAVLDSALGSVPVPR